MKRKVVFGYCQVGGRAFCFGGFRFRFFIALGISGLSVYAVICAIGWYVGLLWFYGNVLCEKWHMLGFNK